MPKRAATSPPSLRGCLYKSHFSEKDFISKDPKEMAKIYQKTLDKLKKGSKKIVENACVSCCLGKKGDTKVCSSCKGPTCSSCLAICGMCDIRDICGNCSISTHQTLCLGCYNSL